LGFLAGDNYYLGIGKLLDARLPHEYQKAFWMLFIGTWFLVAELNLFD